jgi:tRNA(fMet)-specific endonuclease VapC
MARYMLDTDTVSFALRGQGRVAARLLEHRPSELCISSITLAELRYGAESRRSRKLHRLISTFVEPMEIMLFDQSAAGRFGAVAAALARRGEPIGTLDTLMAAHALSLRLTFVTNNTRRFARVAGRQRAGSDSVSRRPAG